MSPSDALVAIHQVIDAGGCPIYTDHMKQRMLERGVTSRQVLKCLKQGIPYESPEYDAEHNSWCIRLLHKPSGEKPLVVVVAIQSVNGKEVILVTTYFRDTGLES